ncbi:MAG: hypothetical protein QXG67_05015, partial [Candidatus Nitrosotenuis sp.]
LLIIENNGMLADSSIRRTLDEYIRRRIMEIPEEIRQAHMRTKQAWKCDHEVDFLYGYFVGRIEEGVMRYLLKATKTSLGTYSDPFEIRAVIESHKNEIIKAVKSSINIK